MTHEIILGGFGGQGLKVISSLLAQAAHQAGKHASMYNIYAAAIRGGPIFCTVIVSDGPIVSAPTTTAPTAVLAMDENTVEVYERAIRPGGTLVVNGSLVKRRPTRTDINVVTVPTNEIAEELGDIKFRYGRVGRTDRPHGGRPHRCGQKLSREDAALVPAPHDPVERAGAPARGGMRGNSREVRSGIAGARRRVRAASG